MLTKKELILADLETETLAQIANEAAEQVEESARKTVEHAERCGRALLAAKSKLPHGKWSAWLQENFLFSVRNAQRYMEIAENTTRVSDLMHATSIRKALRMIAEFQERESQSYVVASVEVVETKAVEASQESLPATSHSRTIVDRLQRQKDAAKPLPERIPHADALDEIKRLLDKYASEFPAQMKYLLSMLRKFESTHGQK